MAGGVYEVVDPEELKEVDKGVPLFEAHDYEFLAAD